MREFKRQAWGAGVATLCCLWSLPPASGQLPAFEQFACPAEVSSVQNLNGGQGWGGPWWLSHRIDATCESVTAETPTPRCTGFTPVDLDADCEGGEDDLRRSISCSTDSGLRSDIPASPKAELPGDDDAHQSDFDVFQRCLSGPGSTADPSCTN